jgi:hypothetical protein
VSPRGLVGAGAGVGEHAYALGAAVDVDEEREELLLQHLLACVHVHELPHSNRQPPATPSTARTSQLSTHGRRERCTPHSGGAGGPGCRAAQGRGAGARRRGSAQGVRGPFILTRRRSAASSTRIFQTRLRGAGLQSRRGSGAGRGGAGRGGAGRGRDQVAVVARGGDVVAEGEEAGARRQLRVHCLRHVPRAARSHLIPPVADPRHGRARLWLAAAPHPRRAGPLELEPRATSPD